MSRIEHIGDATLYLGDALDVLPTLGNLDAVITSPPYGQQRDYGGKISDWRALVSGVLCGVHDSGSTQVLVNLGLIHRNGEVVEYWAGLTEDMRALGWRLFGWYVWDQLSGMTGDWNGRLAPSHEFVFHFNRSSRAVNKTKPTLGRKQTGPGIRKADGTAARKTGHGDIAHPFKIPDSVIRITRETRNSVGPEGYIAAHPARFPDAFARELVEPFTSAGEVVCDPFMGTATTGVACANLGRKFIGIEIEPKYFDIACRRIDEAYKQPRLFAEPPAKPVQTSLLDRPA